MPRVLIWYEGNSDVFFRISERIADRLAEFLPLANIGIALTGRADCLPRLKARGYGVFPYHGPAGHQKKFQVAASLPQNMLRVRRMLKTFRPDVIIITSNFGLAWPLLEQARLLGIRIVYLPHDPQPHSGDYAPLWQRLAQGRVLKRSDALVFLSETMRSFGRTIGGPFQSLPSFVAPLHTLGTPGVSQPRAVVRGRPIRFLFLGRMIRYKGLDLLAEACRLLENRHDWELTLAGAGPEVTQVQADFAGISQVNLGYLRYLDESEIDRLNLEHDVLICPYRDATQSGALAEATLLGLPSIVSPVGALPSQVDDGRAGWVMPDMTASALAEIMRRVIDRPEEVAAMSQAVLDFWKRSSEKNVWQRVIETVLDKRLQPVEHQLARGEATEERAHAPRS
ncbi:MAG: glycosyltransferase family 4 protein [Proteobacteria bacterium]|nr:glycosyltransferase family 4 protein [Pseudomonadota bacterium]